MGLLRSAAPLSNIISSLCPSALNQSSRLFNAVINITYAVPTNVCVTSRPWSTLADVSGIITVASLYKQLLFPWSSGLGFIFTVTVVCFFCFFDVVARLCRAGWGHDPGGSGMGRTDGGRLEQISSDGLIRQMNQRPLKPLTGLCSYHWNLKLLSHHQPIR